MEAKELRIGNFINHNNGFFVGPFTVNSIHISDLERDNAYAKEYEPIPLTEEWLVTLGFEYRTDTGFDGWYSNPILGESIRIFEVENKWYKYSSAHIVIKHVHQIQNLYFALTGEELNKQD